MKNYEKSGEKIILAVGGKNNIQEVKHCFTRLRFKVKDHSKVDINDIEQVEGVIQVLDSMGQIQVVIGNDVKKAYDAVIMNIGEQSKNSENTQLELRNNFKGFKYYGKNILTAISSTVSPILMGLVVAGLFQAFVTIAATTGVLSKESQAFQLLNIMGNSFMYFLPFLVAYSASKYFEANTVLSLMLAGILLHPEFSTLVETGGDVSFFGIPVHLISYSTSLLPMLFTVWIQSLVERIVANSFFKKLGMLSLFPVFVIMAPLTIIITGPLGSILGEIIANAMLFVYNQYSILGILAICLLMPLFIWTGSHWVFFPAALANFASVGFDPFLWIGFTAWNFSQLGVSVAILLKSKNKDLKSFAGSAAFSIATAGISEPAAYGLTLKLKKPIIPSFIGCGIGGLFFAIFRVKVFQLINVSLISIPQFIDPSGGNNLLFAMAGIALVFISTFTMTWFYGFNDDDFIKEN
ncbi:PTS transporter subunit EIIC [Enterococcus avium]|uniref:PTS transporter subunit EIIC n=1 Tax=Enterococcus avium TaxID=33945 RepID=UPI003D6C673B